jgi:Uma2 family endonuclease
MVDTISNLAPQRKESKAVKSSGMTFQSFYKKYVDPGNSAAAGIKYEFCNGQIEKTTSMNRKELFIVKYLTDLFYQLKYKPESTVGGTVVNELETWTSETKWRRPDWAYVTDEQISLGRTDESVVPEFMVEMLSKNDDILIVQKKVYEYFSIGVKVLWIIYSQLRVVHVYTSTKNITVCEDDTDICSAAPVLQGFEISIYDLFKM